MVRYLLPLLLIAALSCTASPDDDVTDVYGYRLNHIEDPTLSTISSAYFNKFFYWRNRPVRVQVDDCTGLAECTSQHVQSLRAGIDLWRANASFFGEISIEEVNSDPDVRISWTRAILNMGMGTATIGQCQYCLGVNGLGQVGAGRPWVITMALVATINSQEFLITQNGIKLVGAHEMGHCLGLFQHSPLNTDLMHSTLSNSTTFNIRDINTLRKLYSEGDQFAPSSVCSTSGASGMQTFTSPEETYSAEFYTPL